LKAGHIKTLNTKGFQRTSYLKLYNLDWLPGIGPEKARKVLRILTSWLFQS